MHKVYDRVCAWNAKRYDQVFDHDLAIDLIQEEFNEILLASTETDKLDGLCDMTYVALGAIWKLGNGFDVAKIRQAFNDVNKLYEVECPAPILMLIPFLLEVEDGADHDMWLYRCLAHAHAEALMMQLTAEQFEEAMLIVCDSNDTKTVEKTASNVKANMDKGPYFTPPEPKLAALLAKRGINNVH